MIFRKGNGGLWTRSEHEEQKRRLEIINRPLPPQVTASVGKTLVCYDRIPRKVDKIEYCFSFPWFYIINPDDPEPGLSYGENGVNPHKTAMGHYITTYSLQCQMDGYPPPTTEEEETFIHHSKRLIGADAEEVENWIRGDVDKHPVRGRYTRLDLE